MEMAPGKAKLVDATPTDPSEAITVTLPRSEIAEAVRWEGGPAPLVLDIQRGRDGADVEAHSLEIAWEKQDLEELLRKTEGEDEVALTFDRGELEQALETDVEGHGIRSTALVLSVAAATTAAFAGNAGARPLGDSGGAVAGSPAVEAVSDAASGHGYATTASSEGLVSDAASGKGYAAPAGDTTQLVSDAASGKGYAAPTETSQLVSDAASGKGYATPASDTTELVSDAASGRGYAPASTELVSDSATGGYQAPTSEASGGGTSVSAPSPAATAGIVGGVALLITGAGFAVRGRRRGPGPQPA